KYTELPELDDDFAKDVSEFDTFAEYKDSVKAKIDERHAKEGDSEVEEKIIEALCEKLEADIPECMYENETENQLRDYANRLSMQGLSLDMYLKYTGLDLDGMRTQFRPRAERQVKTRLALERIAELENIEVSEEDIEKEYQDIAKAYNLDVEKVKPEIDAEMLKADIKVRKAVELVKAAAVITDKAPEEEKPAEDKPADEGSAE
ncbi:MAG: trigger factor, partial [Firmicutes bacterium]|nr:trigger factor [Bacillota bacterium]